MPAFVNFYENLTEANIRLRKTVVLYDGVPHLVHAISNHRKDGVFRIYIDPIGGPLGEYGDYLCVNRKNFQIDQFHHESPELGTYMDGYIETNDGKGILRKKMDSYLFNKFRPFPLGMYNEPAVEKTHNLNPSPPKTYYVERQPQRPNREQGLTRAFICDHPVPYRPINDRGRPGAQYISLYSPAMYDCIMGNYPSPEECLANLRDPTVTNEAVGFHRKFALIRGPVEMLFLGYKTDTIGYLVNGDFSRVKLGRKFWHLSEAVAELGIFDSIVQ